MLFLDRTKSLYKPVYCHWNDLNLSLTSHELGDALLLQCRSFHSSRYNTLPLRKFNYLLCWFLASAIKFMQTKSIDFGLITKSSSSESCCCMRLTKKSPNVLNHSRHHSKTGTSSSHGSSSTHCGWSLGPHLNAPSSGFHLSGSHSCSPCRRLCGCCHLCCCAPDFQRQRAPWLLDKKGSSIYEQGCKALNNKALTDGFGMTTDQTVVFIKAFSCRATAMGRNMGTQQITTFTICGGTSVDLINWHGQIDEATLKTDCERFCKAGEVDAQSHATQNNTMMAICLASLLPAKAQARLLTYRNE